ncbi:Excision repair cross-complementation group 1 [Saguinus oedipus]|uniref:Excision repair cross-complementation group 1 n=1 Tax=Saguinus oedipus TaxID=9490 RepID=A0ABQ9TV83_SAGOE|nr:Excision repair cross-complementation group 1 [Saguinus oedipus]
MDKARRWESVQMLALEAGRKEGGGRWGRGAERWDLWTCKGRGEPKVFDRDGCEWGFLVGDENADADGSLAPGTFPFRLQMDRGKDKEGVPQPAGPPARKKFVIPLDEDAVPPAMAKPLFKSTKSLPTVDTSAQAAPQTYAEYVMSRPPGGPGAPCPTGSEPLAGETRNQAPKPGAKSNSIIVSPRQRGNPVLKFVRNVPWEFGDVIPDYVLGQSTCALFLR